MLEVRQLDAFHGRAQALWDVSLDVADGEIVSVIGPNGAGKSTLVTAIAGLLRPIAGQITLDGADLAGLPAHRVCTHGVAIVPEGRRIFAHMTVRENLLLGAHRRDARDGYEATLGRVVELFPRLAERAGQQAVHLSGGEQQMLAIGRALMAKPRLLLLDEPSLGLAPVVVDEVFEVVAAITDAGVSVLLVEQEVDRALEAAARGYVLVEGQIVAAGSSAELRANDAVQRRVLGL